MKNALLLILIILIIILSGIITIICWPFIFLFEGSTREFYFSLLDKFEFLNQN